MDNLTEKRKNFTITPKNEAAYKQHIAYLYEIGVASKEFYLMVQKRDYVGC